MAASTSGVPSAAVTTKVAAEESAAARESGKRSRTGARLVGITYSLVVSSIEPVRAGVRTCSTTTDPSPARSAVDDTIRARYTRRSPRGEGATKRAAVDDR